VGPSTTRLKIHEYFGFVPIRRVWVLSAPVHRDRAGQNPPFAASFFHAIEIATTDHRIAHHARGTFGPMVRLDIRLDFGRIAGEPNPYIPQEMRCCIHLAKHRHNRSDKNPKRVRRTCRDRRSPLASKHAAPNPRRIGQFRGNSALGNRGSLLYPAIPETRRHRFSLDIIRSRLWTNAARILDQFDTASQKQ
jgi:hypothetical protein